LRLSALFFNKSLLIKKKKEFLDTLQAQFSQEWQMQQAIQQLVHLVEEWREESRQSMEEIREERRKFCSQMISELDNMLNICRELDEEEARTESIKADMASETQVTIEEGLGLSTEMESMNAKNISQISKDVEISVNRQMFDEIPQPIQTALKISEYVRVEIIDLMWKNLGGAANLTLVMKTMPKIVVNYSTASCVMVLVFKHRWRWKFSNKHPSSVIVSSTGVWVRECRDDCTSQFQPEPEEILDRPSPNMNSGSKK
jgi:membrane-associated HD superfamily phosphohydrolase